MNADNVARLPRRPLPEDPMAGLRELVAEYGAASNRDRNYGSAAFAHLFWCYLTEVMPLLEQRHADHTAAMDARITRILASAGGEPPPRPQLKVVK